MIVYVLVYQDYDDSSALGVFDAREDAIKNAKKLISKGLGMKWLHIAKGNVGQTILDNEETGFIWNGDDKDALDVLIGRKDMRTVPDDNIGFEDESANDMDVFPAETLDFGDEEEGTYDSYGFFDY